VKRITIPKATVARLPVYLQCLESLPGQSATVSSETLANIASVTSAKVRKDLSYLGSHGVRGVGYDVEQLCLLIRKELGLTEDWPVVIVGVGNLGSALANYGGFGSSGYRVVGVYDADPSKIGRGIGGLIVRGLADLSGDVESNRVSIGIITTPASAAQEIAELLTTAGVGSILNFAPVVVRVPPTTRVRNVDLATELQILSYYSVQAR